MPVHLRNGEPADEQWYTTPSIVSLTLSTNSQTVSTDTKPLPKEGCMGYISTGKPVTRVGPVSEQRLRGRSSWGPMPQLPSLFMQTILPMAPAWGPGWIMVPLSLIFPVLIILPHTLRLYLVSYLFQQEYLGSEFSLLGSVGGKRAKRFWGHILESIRIGVKSWLLPNLPSSLTF